MTGDPYPYDDDPPCFGMGDIMMPEFGAGGWDQQTKNLLTDVCAKCPAIVSCRDDAMERDLPGWWGGTTYLFRRRLRRRAKAGEAAASAAHPAAAGERSATD